MFSDDQGHAKFQLIPPPLNMTRTVKEGWADFFVQTLTSCQHESRSSSNFLDPSASSLNGKASTIDYS
jgi:hypothetical protein